MMAFSKIVGFNNAVSVIFEWVKVKQYYFFFLAGLLIMRFKDKITNALDEQILNTSLAVSCIVIFLTPSIDVAGEEEFLRF